MAVLRSKVRVALDTMRTSAPSAVKVITRVATRVNRMYAHVPTGPRAPERAALHIRWRVARNVTPVTTKEALSARQTSALALMVSRPPEYLARSMETTNALLVTMATI